MATTLAAQEAAPASGTGVSAAGMPVAQEGTKPILKVGGSVLPPKLTHQAKLHYSKEARKNKISGVVEVRLYVDEKGLPQDVRIVRGLGYGLDEEALKAVKKYHFQPATFHGAPVKVQIYIDVNFVLL